MIAATVFGVLVGYGLLCLAVGSLYRRAIARRLAAVSLDEHCATSIDVCDSSPFTADEIVQMRVRMAIDAAEARHPSGRRR